MTAPTEFHDYPPETRCIHCDRPLHAHTGRQRRDDVPPSDTDGYCSRACALAQQRKVFGAPLVELAADRARPIASVHREQFEKAMRRAWTENGLPS